MKAKNINVGEWVFGKLSKALVFVGDEDIAINMRQNTIHFRRPTIADLNKGDVFEWEVRNWTFLNVLPNGLRRALRSCNSVTSLFASEAKVKIISLASEKVEPERKTATIWVNIGPTGSLGAYRTRSTAESMARKNRVACVKVSFPWTKGEGLGE